MNQPLSFNRWSVWSRGERKNKRLILIGKITLPSSIFGDRHSYPQPRGSHSLADWFHVNNWVDAVWASHNATLRIRTETAVVQTLVAVISATLLQRDSGGHTWDSDMNNQLANKGNNKKSEVWVNKIRINKILLSHCTNESYHICGCFFSPEMLMGPKKESMAILTEPEMIQFIRNKWNPIMITDNCM